jgi:hypothetical protein
MLKPVFECASRSAGLAPLWIVGTRDAYISVLQCLLARFIYMVETTISLGGQAFDIDVEGEVERDENGAKDSAVARLMAWLREQGVSLG